MRVVTYYAYLSAMSAFLLLFVELVGPMVGIRVANSLVFWILVATLPSGALVGLVVSAAMAGMAGSLYAHYTRFVSPEVFLFGYTVTMVIMVVAGGKGTLAGPLVGAFIFTALPDELNQGAIYRIIYFHVPANILGMTGFGLGMLLSIGYLVTKDLRYDALAASVTEVSPAQYSPVNSISSAPFSRAPRLPFTSAMKIAWISRWIAFSRATSSAFSGRNGSSVALCSPAV